MKRFSEEQVRQAIRDIEDEAYEKFGRDVEIIVDGYNVIFDDDDIADPVYAKVNWAATGSQKPEDAETFANKILEAVEMAEAFPYNGAVLRAEGDDEDGYVFWYEMRD